MIVDPAGERTREARGDHQASVQYGRAKRQLRCRIPATQQKDSLDSKSVSETTVNAGKTDTWEKRRFHEPKGETRS